MKFAHIADAHLGAFSKNPVLRDMNIRAFEMAVDMSIEERVDFVLIAGDLFHNPIPDMEIVKRGVEALKKLRDEGIRVYAIYGSHDFSAGSTSLLDVLNSTGLFQKVVNYEMVDDKIRLIPFRDETGVSIVGMSGLSSSAEVEYFQYLDLDYLKSIQGPKIFAFHTTISEVKPSYIPDKYALPKSLLPRGFDYYAAGHLHERIESDVDGSPLIYPGALFGATYSDLDNLEDRGFYIVEDFKPKFRKVEVCRFVKKVVKADGLTARELEEKLMAMASENYEGSVVILKVRGELESGEISDIDFHSIREKFKETALEILLNTYSLKTKERRRIQVVGETKEDIEEEVFRRISRYGVDFTRKVFQVLKERRPEDMTKEDFNSMLIREVETMLQGLEIGEESREEEPRKGDEKEKRKEVKRATLFDFGVGE